jgi:cytochrome c553
MKSSFTFSLVAVTLTAIGSISSVSWASDIAAGQQKAEVCAACHGKDGNTPIDPSYPKLAGQHANYLERTLKNYKSGARKNAIMAAQAALLSNKDIENLSAYYASLPGTLTVKK